MEGIYKCIGLEHGKSMVAVMPGFLSIFPSKSAKKGKKRKEGVIWRSGEECNIYALHLPEYLVILGDKLIYLVE